MMTPVYGQTELFLKKGLKKVWLEDIKRVRLSVRTDTSQNEPYYKLWNIKQFDYKNLMLEKIVRFEYDTIPKNQENKYIQKGWKYDFSIRKNYSDPDSWQLIMKKPTEIVNKTVDYKDIYQIQYAKSDSKSGCIMCIFLPVGMVVAPFAAWQNGKFDPGIFAILFIPSFALTIGTYNSLKHRELKTYNLDEWELKSK